MSKHICHVLLLPQNPSRAFHMGLNMAGVWLRPIIGDEQPVTAIFPRAKQACKTQKMPNLTTKNYTCLMVLFLLALLFFPELVHAQISKQEYQLNCQTVADRHNATYYPPYNNYYDFCVEEPASLGSPVMCYHVYSKNLNTGSTVWNSSVQLPCWIPTDPPERAPALGTPDDKICPVKGPKYSQGNPVNIASGNKFQMETDYVASGTSPLRFIRFYNSLNGLWRHSYSARLAISTNQILFIRDDGREIVFARSGPVVTPPPTEIGTLTQDGNNWVYSSLQKERLTFDDQGKLIQVIDSGNKKHSLTYSGDLITVSDELGQSLSFRKNAQQQLLSLNANSIQASYTYNPSGLLVNVTKTHSGMTSQRSYHYEDSRESIRHMGWLTGITDERGVRYATWEYDAIGRVIKSVHADGADQVLLTYNSGGTVTLTNALGKKATYSFDFIQGAKRITAIKGEPSAGCPVSNSSFTYDDNGLLKTMVDNKGFVITYDYNARGLETSRTEAYGTSQARTITTTWHPTLNLPLTITEPGRVITYTYDTAGRQLSQTITAL